MAVRFLSAGYKVVVHDTARPRVQELVALGASAANSPRELANRASVVIASVPDAEASRKITGGADSIVEGKAVRCYVETSTIGVAASREIARQLETHNIHFIDAPVSGGPRAVSEGILTAIVSAPGKLVDEVQSIMTVLCNQLIIVGEKPGQAQACKLVNNAISLAILQIASEVSVFGVMAGLDARLMINAVNASSGSSRVTQTKFPISILTRKFDFGASMATATKDMRLFVSEAQKMGAFLQSTPLIAQIWEEATEAGDPHRDFTEIIKWFEGHVGVEVGLSEEASVPRQ
jgi:3-hydroxyisobutyrate dehydrogenase-like beta-hydroxyacid dehydrogenase